MRALRAGAGILLLLIACGTAGAADLNLYDWMGKAPIVVYARVARTSTKLVDLEIRAVLRGPLERDKMITVHLRVANRERSLTETALRLPEGESYLVLLETAPPRKKAERPQFRLVRGIHGVREVPREGGQALLGAARALARIQDRKSESARWQGMEGLLEDTNPLLLATALDHHLKFDRGEPELLLTIRPLLDHPQPDLRERAARLIAEILSRRGGPAIPESSMLQAELAGRARRDDAAAVRVAATRALHLLSGEGTEDLLQEIASDDPDQSVRYTAERLLYERRNPDGARPDGT